MGEPMLRVVRTRLELDPTSPDRLEDELIRSGARGARMLRDGTIAVTVAARAPEDAVALVRDLMTRVAESVCEVVSVR